MATTKFQVPNWSQAAMAEKLSLNPDELAVRLEDDKMICFLRHIDRKEFIVDKVTGRVTEC